eukprot:TRINITY_DN35051_c0_g1_i1.p1 TRINITY_DN35051_c0_g1~~TRINITY_DN35051_c0_g1_i1.p1  ORF type:complete len:409 (+),score=81.98 TRINITY_DN35051_c0_g1_i1:182-1408(+)
MVKQGCLRALRKITGMDERDTYFAMHSPPWVISGLILTAAVFIPIGVLVLIATDKYQEKIVQYGEQIPCTYDRRRNLSGLANPLPHEIPDHCPTTVTFTLSETMESPVFMYYSITDYNQNFRNLVRSRSDSQLRGDETCSCDDADACPPFTHVAGRNASEEAMHIVFGSAKIRLDKMTLSPCGQMAYVMFNDSFVLTYNNTQSQLLICNSSDFNAQGVSLLGSQRLSNSVNTCLKQGIEWPGDRESKYGPAPISDSLYTRAGKRFSTIYAADGLTEIPEYNPYMNNGFYWREWGHMLPDPEDLDFMVWMKPSSLPTIKKLHRRITTDLPAGTYKLQVEDRYDVSKFGDKRLILATRSWVGADNTVLAVCYLFIGSLAFLCALIFTILHLRIPKGGYTPSAFHTIEALP